MVKRGEQDERLRAFDEVSDGGTPIPVDRQYYPEPTRFRRELKRAASIYEALSKAAGEVIGTVRTGQPLDPTPLQKPITEMVSSVVRHPDAMVWMRKLDTQDSYLTGHSVRIAVLSTVLGRAMGMPQVRLERLAQASLMSQIGKTKLPRSLLEKAGPLSDEDRERVRGFITLGVELIRDCPVLSEDVANIVLCHHERFDGSGYPAGLRGDGIPVLSRLIGLADWYDGATTPKPYNPGVLSANEAMDALYRQRGKLFQSQVVEEFIRAMGIYPIGNWVELNIGEIALIEALNLDHRTQPRIIRVLDRDRRPLKRFERIDLIRHNRTTDQRPLTIKRVLPAGEVDMDPNDVMAALDRQQGGWRRLLGR